MPPAAFRRRRAQPRLVLPDVVLEAHRRAEASDRELVALGFSRVERDDVAEVLLVVLLGARDVDLASLIGVTVPFSSVMIALFPFTVYLARAKMSEPSFSLMT